MARTPAREPAILEIVRAVLRPLNPLEGIDRPDEAGFIASGSAPTDGVGVGTGAASTFCFIPDWGPHQEARLQRAALRAAWAEQALKDNGDPVWFGAVGLNASLSSGSGRSRTYYTLVLAALLNLRFDDPLVQRLFALGGNDDESAPVVLQLVTELAQRAHLSTLAAVLALALLADEHPAEAEATAPAARSGAPPGADRTPRQQRVGLAARGRATAKESGNASAGLLPPPTEGRQATRTGTRRPAA